MAAGRFRKNKENQYEKLRHKVNNAIEYTVRPASKTQLPTPVYNIYKFTLPVFLFLVTVGGGGVWMLLSLFVCLFFLFIWKVRKAYMSCLCFPFSKLFLF